MSKYKGGGGGVVSKYLTYIWCFFVIHFLMSELVFLIKRQYFYDACIG